MAAPCMIFDLDGTLVDTAPDLVDSLNRVLRDAGEPDITRDAVGFHVGLGGRAMIERAFALRRRPLDEAAATLLVGRFMAHYAASLPGRARLYPGVVDLLDRHERAGFVFGICTNKPQDMADRLIRGLGVADRFAAICGADRFAFRKPDPRHLLETVRLAGGRPDAAIMVGDSKTDILAAKAAGIPVVAVDFGYSDRPVREYEPSMVVSQFQSLAVERSHALLRALAA